MRISHVGGVHASFSHQKNNISSRGLWGVSRISQNSISHYGGRDFDVHETLVTKVYHPFKDESIEHIKKIVKDNTKKTRTTGNFERYDTFTRVEVQPKLKFTEAQYLNYQRKNLGNRMKTSVENKLKLANLVEYLKK